MRIVVVLPGPVGAAEAEHLPGRDGEAHPLEHPVVAVALDQAVELEHGSSGSSWCITFLRDRIGSPPSRRAARAVSSAHEQENAPRSRPTGVGLDGLRAAAAGCRACELWEPATRTVFGEGPETARIVFVGEQPGDQEDRRASRSSGPPDGCSTARWPTPASTAATPTSPTRSSTSGSRRRRSGGSTRRPAPSTCGPAGRGWRRSSRCSAGGRRVPGGHGGQGAHLPVVPDHQGARPADPVDPAGVARRPARTTPTPTRTPRHQTWMLATTHPSAVLRVPDEGRAAAYDALVTDLTVARGASPRPAGASSRTCGSRRPVAALRGPEAAEGGDGDGDDRHPDQDRDPRRRPW